MLVGANSIHPKMLAMIYILRFHTIKSQIQMSLKEYPVSFKIQSTNADSVAETHTAKGAHMTQDYSASI